MSALWPAPDWKKHHAPSGHWQNGKGELKPYRLYQSEIRQYRIVQWCRCLHREWNPGFPKRGRTVSPTVRLPAGDDFSDKKIVEIINGLCHNNNEKPDGFRLDASDVPDLVPILGVLGAYCEENPSSTMQPA